ncbi:HAD family hydrolase [Muricoccus radiodurans]|uniref:HAD family hydrolase n=1 Tax=Muricoccus radiodurans TaxID=2231721 RepID=UPI003CE9D390
MITRTLAARARLPEQPAAVILDMDGTLLDTEGAYRDAFLSAVRALGAEVTDAFYASLVGISSRERGALVLAHLGPSFPWQDCLRDYRARKARLLAGTLRTKPGAAELLGELRREGLPRAVATSAGRETATAALRKTGLLDEVTALVTRDDVAVGKPHPALFLEAARALDTPAERCVAVEDSAPGIAAARAAGMQVIVVPDGTPPLLTLPTDRITMAADLSEVRALLRDLRNGDRADA